METVRSNARQQFKHQEGMTLVELVISLTISGILLTLLFQFLSVQSTNFIQNRDVAEMQQELRWGMQFVAEHVKLAGNTVPQVLIDDTGYKVLDNKNGPSDAPDTLSILGSFRSIVITLDQAMGNEGSQIKCSDKANSPAIPLEELFMEGDLAFISDGTFSEVFQITKIQADHLWHEAAPPWNDDNKLDHRYTAGSTLTTLTRYTLYVATDETGHQNLVVQSQAYPPQILCGDVEDFQIRFKMKGGQWQDTINSSEITLNEVRQVEIYIRARSKDPIQGYRDTKYNDAYKHLDLKSLVIPKSIAVM